MLPSRVPPGVLAVSTPVHDRWWRPRPRLAVAAIAVAAMGLHALFLGVPLAPDEGGYLLVARQWHDSGPLLYGHLWVDRPPLLLAAFALAGPFGATEIHVLACLCAGAMVAVSGWAGWAVAGNTAARWSALAAAALSASALVGAQELDGEMLAIPFVMLACALLLHAWYRDPRGQYLFAAATGVAAIAAMLIKQNFVEGLAFAVVFLGVHIVRAKRVGSSDRRRAAHMLAAFSFGVVARSCRRHRRRTLVDWLDAGALIIRCPRLRHDGGRCADNRNGESPVGQQGRSSRRMARANRRER